MNPLTHKVGVSCGFVNILSDRKGFVVNVPKSSPCSSAGQRNYSLCAKVNKPLQATDETLFHHRAYKNEKERVKHLVSTEKTAIKIRERNNSNYRLLQSERCALNSGRQTLSNNIYDTSLDGHRELIHIHES